MAARADLAKRIRVEVKERSMDRARERTGRTIEQDIEVVREEQVNELLKEVKIVDRLIDKASGSLCQYSRHAKAADGHRSNISLQLIFVQSSSAGRPIPSPFSS